MFTDNKTLRTAIVLSFVFHIFLLLIFFFINVNYKYNIAEFTEIAFASGRSALTRSTPISTISQPIQKNNLNTEPSANIITLPKRKLVDDKKELIKVTDNIKKISSDVVKIIPQPSSNEKLEKPDYEFLNKPNLAEKEIALHDNALSPGDKILPLSDTEKFGDPGQQMPYEIEGQAAPRTVTYKIIPEYPANLQKQALVKINFTVLPNGRIGEMIPRIKADAQLEKITMDALRQWRFNPLPSYKPQEIERGVITFRYLLK